PRGDNEHDGGEPEKAKKKQKHGEYDPFTDTCALGVGHEITPDKINCVAGVMLAQLGSTASPPVQQMLLIDLRITESRCDCHIKRFESIKCLDFDMIILQT
ncbi:hypothetical protein LCGC14_1730680, partial [marine sediment metagenome]